jgi:flagellar L-ring protein precursor FlgH
MTRLAAGVLLFASFVTAVPASAQSLWREGRPGASLFVDHRARAVDDIVTIVIDEESSSSRTGNTKTTKDTSRTASINKFPTLLDPLAKKLKPITNPALKGKPLSTFLEGALTLDISGNASHEGKGAIERTDKVSGQIAARVVKVLDNGNLMIEGRRAILVNEETQVITISGVVRPEDISGTNTVLSSQIADAEVQMVGKGVIADTQHPGWLYRLFDWIGLF